MSRRSSSRAINAIKNHCSAGVGIHRMNMMPASALTAAVAEMIRVMAIIAIISKWKMECREAWMASGSWGWCPSLPDQFSWFSGDTSSEQRKAPERWLGPVFRSVILSHVLDIG